MDKNQQSTLAITGMTCGGCVNAVKRRLSQVPGVSSAEVHLETGRAVVVGSAHPEELVKAVRAGGYGVQIS